MVCDARTEAGYDPILEIRRAVGVGPRSMSAFFDNIYITEFFEILLKRVRN